MSEKKDLPKILEDAAKELSGKAYEDVLHPAFQEVGKKVGGLVRIALSPVGAMIWGYEKIAEYLEKAITIKLKDVDPLHIKTPPTEIAGPAIEALRFTGDNENLRDLFATLIATVMNSNKSGKAHPSFVETIKNLSADEAVILKTLARTLAFPVIDLRIRSVNTGISTSLGVHSGLEKVQGLQHQEMIRQYTDNLIRLRIIEVDMDRYISDENVYSIFLKSLLETVYPRVKDSAEKTLTYDKGVLRLTNYGTTFIESVMDIPPTIAVFGIK